MIKKLLIYSLLLFSVAPMGLAFEPEMGDKRPGWILVF